MTRTAIFNSLSHTVVKPCIGQLRRLRDDISHHTQQVAVSRTRLILERSLLLLTRADRQLGQIDKLTAVRLDHDPTLITHIMADSLRARVFAIACGYLDADDLDDQRKSRASKLAA